MRIKTAAYKTASGLFIASHMDQLLKTMVKKRPVVLTYHSIPANAVKYYDVAGEYFGRQLEYLTRNYDIVTVNSIIDHLRYDTTSGRPKIALTFDDGYENHHSIVSSLLKKYRVPAVFFITIEYIGMKGMLTWNQIIEMAKSSFVQIGCHSYSHPDLTSLSSSEIAKEVRTSKQILEEKLKQKVELFSYPGGCYNEKVKEIVKSSGYKGALAGLNRQDEDNPFEIRRIWLGSRTQELNYFLFWILRALLTDLDEYQRFAPEALDRMIRIAKGRLKIIYPLSVQDGSLTTF